MPKKPKQKKLPLKKKPAAKKKAGGSALTRSLAKLLDYKRQLKKLEASQAPLKKKLEDLANQVIQKYTEDDISSVKTKAGSVTRVSQTVPQLDDFAMFFDWVTKNDASDLLHKRVSSEAWRERVDTGITVPGVSPFTKVSLQIRLKGEG